MSNLTITNLDTGNVILEEGSFRDETLTLSGAQTIAAGTILARSSSTGKLVVFVPGGQAIKSTSSGPFNLVTGDTAVIATNGGSNETSTFTAAAATIADTTTYTGGTAATITDNFTHGADQVGLTFTVNTIDAINGTTSTLVTIAAACTTAVALAAEIAAQVPGILTSVAAGHVVMTTTEVGLDVSISVTAGTSAVTWAAPVAGTGGLANQQGLTAIVTLTGGEYDGVAQTVTFTATSGFVTELVQIVAQLNAGVDGASFSASGGQVLGTTDGQGTGMDIAVGAGTGGLTWAASTAGTGNVADINAVTATEVKTIVEAATTDLTVTVTGAAAVFTATTSIQFVSGNAIAKLGLSVETVYAYENGIPKAILTYDLAGANGDNAVRAGVAGKYRDQRLVINNGTSMTQAIRDQLRDYGLVPLSVTELGNLDNQ